MGQIAESYKRWRHTRGYGVHSPYAYSVVKEVVRPGRRYAYYGYDDIDNAIDSNAVRHARRMATTLLRLAAFLRTDTAFKPVSYGIESGKFEDKNYFRRAGGLPLQAGMFDFGFRTSRHFEVSYQDSGTCHSHI